MSVTDVPKSAFSLTSLLQFPPLPAEPLDCSTPSVLDLSCRRSTSQSPQPEGAHCKLTPSPPLQLPLSPPASTGVFTSSGPELDSSEEGSIKSDDLSLYPSHNPAKSPKAARPFKAYPKDPFILALGASTADALLGQESTEAYAEFRRKMLCQVRSSLPPGVTNAKMRRSNLPTSIQDFNSKDASYWEKRRKNNEAAKRSRDARRAKEDEIAIRAAFLEQENLKLKYEIAALRNENTKFRCLLYN